MKAKKRRGRGRRRREEEEEGIKPKRYGNYFDHGIEWIHGTLRLCMINIMSPNLGFIELHLNLRFLEIKVGKTHKEQDKQRILSFKMDSWLIESL